MALPSLTTHRKFRRLVRLLGEPEAHVRGYLETMWDKGYGNGDPHIGNDSLDVADACGYPGSPDAIASALASCGGEGRPGFVDADEDGSYYIHNLNRHAPRYVRQRRATNLARDAGLGRLGMTSHQGRDVVMRLAASGHCDLDRPDLDAIARMARGDFGGPTGLAEEESGATGRHGAPPGRPLATSGATGQQNAPSGASQASPDQTSTSQSKAEGSSRAAAREAADPERSPPFVWVDQVWPVASDLLGRPKPTRQDRALLKRWHDDKLDPQRLVDLIRVVAARPTSDPPATLSYFEPIVAGEVDAVDDRSGQRIGIFEPDAAAADEGYREYALANLDEHGWAFTDRQRDALRRAVSVVTTARALELLSVYTNRTYSAKAVAR